MKRLHSKYPHTSRPLFNSERVAARTEATRLDDRLSKRLPHLCLGKRYVHTKTVRKSRIMWLSTKFFRLAQFFCIDIAFARIALVPLGGSRILGGRWATGVFSNLPLPSVLLGATDSCFGSCCWKGLPSDTTCSCRFCNFYGRLCTENLPKSCFVLVVNRTANRPAQPSGLGAVPYWPGVPEPGPGETPIPAVDRKHPA